jgi:hypothetical protein
MTGWPVAREEMGRKSLRQKLRAAWDKVMIHCGMACDRFVARKGPVARPASQISPCTASGPNP